MAEFDIRVDGSPVSGITRAYDAEGGTVAFDLANLADGNHTIDFKVSTLATGLLSLNYQVFVGGFWFAMVLPILFWRIWTKPRSTATPQNDSNNRLSLSGCRNPVLLVA